MPIAVLDTEVVIEREGRPLVVIIPYEDYVALQERLEDLEDALAIAQAKEEYDRDPSSVRPYAEFRTELVAEGLLDE